MNCITIASALQNFAKIMDDVCDNHAPVIVTGKRDRAVVLVSLEDFESMEETAYLMRSPSNASRLLNAVKSLQG